MVGHTTYLLPIKFRRETHLKDSEGPNSSFVTVDIVTQSRSVSRQSRIVRERSVELLRHGESLLAAIKLTSIPENKNIIKRCGCGMKYTASEWFALPFVGWQYSVPELRGELRNCVCHSTLFFVSYRKPKP